MNPEFVAVPRSAVEWLKQHYPAICEKSGLAERIGGTLYTKTSLPQGGELLRVARLIEDLKRDCGMDPDSPIAIQNARYMSIATILRDLSDQMEGGA